MSLKLFSGDVELGTLTTDGIDWPRTYYHFAPAPGFEGVREFFDHHVRADRSVVEDFDAFEERCLELDLRIVDHASHTITYMDVVFVVGGSEAVVRHDFIRRIDERGIVKWVRHDGVLPDLPED